IAGGGERHQYIARLTQAANLTGERLCKTIIIANRGERRSIRAQRNGRQAWPFAFKASDQFGGEMLRIGRRTAIAANKDFAIIRQTVGHPVDSRRQRRRKRVERLLYR